MRRRPAPARRVLVVSAFVLGSVACADDPVQPRAAGISPVTAAPTFSVDVGSYTATDLGTLGGLHGTATGINDNGFVAGHAHNDVGNDRSFLWTPAGMQDLNVSFRSFAQDVNDAGQVVGYIDAFTGPRAFLWTPGEGVRLLPLFLGGRTSQAFGINNRGQVVGRGSTISGALHAFLWTPDGTPDGSMQDLGTLPASGGFVPPSSTAFDINDHGVVVGSSTLASGLRRAVVWTAPGQVVDLGTLGDGLLGRGSSSASGINNHGHVVGSTDTPFGQRAFLWTPSGSMQNLGTPDGTDHSGAESINDRGEIVGVANVPRSEVQFAVLWRGGVMTVLPDLGGMRSAAHAIDNSGRIVGSSRNALGQTRPTIWNLNRAPVASAGGPYSGFEGTPISFIGSATDPDGDRLTVSWAFGDGAAASSAEASHTYVDQDTVMATFTATDPSGLSATATAIVHVENLPPIVTMPAPVTIYSGQAFTLVASFSDPGTRDAPWSTSINWGEGAGTMGVTNDQSAPITASHQYIQAATHTVVVVVDDKDGGRGTGTVEVTVLRVPVKIDVEPRDANNVILTGGPTLDVALLTTDDYDAQLVQPASVVITNGSGSGTRLAETRRGSDYNYVDINRDGRLDLVLSFRKLDMVRNGDLTLTTTKLSLLAEGGDARQIVGEDAVTVRP